jgi:hypothetical protein
LVESGPRTHEREDNLVYYEFIYQSDQLKINFMENMEKSQNIFLQVMILKR